MTSSEQIWVFAGPSLPPAARPRRDGFLWRGPAMAGDGLEALAAGARAVVLIDGVFDRYPAIRHKELLALLEAGVPVLGGASMRAFRAAEMHTLGMVGVGAVFQAFACGWLTGDDEVALLHGPAEMGWAALTLPLVNARATLMRAVRRHVLTATQGRAVLRAAQAQFYQDRTWRTVMAAAEAELPRAPLLRFADWVRGGQFDVKRRDALSCLAAARALDPGPHLAGSPRTCFTAALARQVESGLKPARAFA